MSQTHQQTSTHAPPPILAYDLTLGIWLGGQRQSKIQTVLDSQGILIVRDASPSGGEEVRASGPSFVTGHLIKIPDTAVSALHARIYVDFAREPPAPVVLDLRSSNGTRVDASGEADPAFPDEMRAGQAIISAVLGVHTLIRLGKRCEGYHIRVESLTPCDAVSLPAVEHPLVSLGAPLSQQRIDAMRQLYGATTPQHVLICGGPGMGKSHWATYLARQWAGPPTDHCEEDRIAPTQRCNENLELDLSIGDPEPVIIEDIECLIDVGQEQLCELLAKRSRMILTTGLRPDQLRTWCMRTDLAPYLACMTLIVIPPLTLTAKDEVRFFAKMFDTEYFGPRKYKSGRRYRGDRLVAHLSAEALEFISSVEWPNGLRQLKDAILLTMLEIGLQEEPKRKQARALVKSAEEALTKLRLAEGARGGLKDAREANIKSEREKLKRACEAAERTMAESPRPRDVEFAGRLASVQAARTGREINTAVKEAKKREELWLEREVTNTDIAQTYGRHDLVIQCSQYDSLTLEQFLRLAKQTYITHVLVRERGNLTRIGEHHLDEAVLTDTKNGKPQGDRDKKPRRLLKQLGVFWDHERGTLRLPEAGDMPGLCEPVEGFDDEEQTGE